LLDKHPHLLRLQTIALLIVLLAPFAYKTYLVADFVLLQDYYATELCVNKDDVSKNCNGLCQLNQALSSTQQEQDSAPINLQEIQLPHFLVPSFFQLTKLSLVEKVKHSYSYSFGKNSSYFNPPSKPPQHFC
jgi:hypothetical protein